MLYLYDVEHVGTAPDGRAGSCRLRLRRPSESAALPGEYPPETGLDYFGARYFSGAQGRFTSPDAPFYDQWPAHPQSWNLYSYARNNPLRYTDPTGTAAFDQSGSWAGDYDGEKDCSTNSGCLYWHQKTGGWEKKAPPPNSRPGGIITGVGKDLYNGFVFGYNLLGWASDQVDGIPTHTSHRLEYLKPSTQAEQRGMTISLAAGFLGFGLPGSRRLASAIHTRNVHGGTAAVTRCWPVPRSFWVKTTRKWPLGSSVLRTDCGRFV